jgi:hypothetical protein
MVLRLVLNGVVPVIVVVVVVVLVVSREEIVELK